MWQLKFSIYKKKAELDYHIIRIGKCHRSFGQIRKLTLGWKQGNTGHILVENSTNSWLVVTRETLFFSSLKLHSVLGTLMQCVQCFSFHGMSLTKTFCHQTDQFLSQVLKSFKFLNTSVSLWVFRSQMPPLKLCFFCQRVFKSKSNKLR